MKMLLGETWMLADKAVSGFADEVSRPGRSKKQVRSTSVMMPNFAFSMSAVKRADASNTEAKTELKQKQRRAARRNQADETAKTDDWHQSRAPTNLTKNGNQSGRPADSNPRRIRWIERHCKEDVIKEPADQLSDKEYCRKLLGLQEHMSCC